MRQAVYRQIAADLRDAIARGEHAPGAVLPKITELMARYGVARQTVRDAIAVLEAEGLVEARRRRGTVVRQRPKRQRIVKRRAVYRDDLGYLFSNDSADWRELRPSIVEYRPTPPEIASLLRLPAGTDALVRDRLLGDRTQRERRQSVVSYFPGDLARGTVLERPRTGPGGTADRLEIDLGLGPLRWEEEISAEAAGAAEAANLDLPEGAPVLRIVRVAYSHTGQPCEVCDTRMSGEQYIAAYPLRRDRTARWPVPPATAHPTDPDTPTKPQQPGTEANE